MKSYLPYLTAIFCWLLVIACQSDSGDTANTAPPPSSMSGEKLARIHCATCHPFPEPGELDKKSWVEGVLPVMGHRFGFFGPGGRAELIESGVGGQLVEQANIYPHAPTLAREDWAKIVDYYRENAPATLEAPFPELAPTDRFTATPLPGRYAPPMGTFIQSSTDGNVLYYSDVKGDVSHLELRNADRSLIQRIALPQAVSSLNVAGDTLFATLLGSFTPSDAPNGSLAAIFKTSGSSKYDGFRSLVKGLQRPVAAARNDLNNDGLTDFVVCEYGNHTGRLSWYAGKADGSFERRVLLEQPGAVSVKIHDLDGDGRQDIIALMAQGNEGIDVYYNVGGGVFNRERLLQFPSVYGSVNLRVDDFNADGHADLLYINGDNADYSMIDKPYHGLHFYLNDGSGTFSKSWFYPFPGAYDARLGDFDGDGDRDVLAVSFFPKDYKPENGVVYLENQGGQPAGGNFVARSVPGTETGRWIGLDVRKGGARPQVQLLSFTGLELAPAYGQQYQKWLQSSPSVLQLTPR